MAKAKGRVKQVVGWVTGDRRVEAEGLVEAETGHPPDPEEAEEAELEVRVAHGDVAVPGHERGQER